MTIPPAISPSDGDSSRTPGRTPRSASSRAAAPGGQADEQGRRLIAYRDDGPVAMALAAAVGGRVPPLAATVLSGAIMLVFLTGFASAGAGFLWALLPVLVLCAAAASHPHTGRFDWLVPPLMRAIEYSFLAVLGFTHEVSKPLVFILIGVLAYHHYDTVYRTRQGLWPQRWVFRAGLGWDGRTLIAALAAVVAGTATGATAGEATSVTSFAYAGLAVYLGLLFGVESVYTWVGAGRGAGVEVDLENVEDVEAMNGANGVNGADRAEGAVLPVPPGPPGLSGPPDGVNEPGGSSTGESRDTVGNGK